MWTWRAAAQAACQLRMSNCTAPSQPGCWPRMRVSGVFEVARSVDQWFIGAWSMSEAASERALLLLLSLSLLPAARLWAQGRLGTHPALRTSLSICKYLNSRERGCGLRPVVLHVRMAWGVRVGSAPPRDSQPAASSLPAAVNKQIGGAPMPPGPSYTPPQPRPRIPHSRSPPARKMGSTMEEIMRKRRQEAQDAYEAQWADGRGSHHPDFDPIAVGPTAPRASRATEEMYLAIVANDVSKVYDKIDEGADVNWAFGRAYSCEEGYTPLMVACHRGRCVDGAHGAVRERAWACAGAPWSRCRDWGARMRGGRVQAGHALACMRRALHHTDQPPPTTGTSARAPCCAPAQTPTTPTLQATTPCSGPSMVGGCCWCGVCTHVCVRCTDGCPAAQQHCRPAAVQRR